MAKRESRERTTTRQRLVEDRDEWIDKYSTLEVDHEKRVREVAELQAKIGGLEAEGDELRRYAKMLADAVLACRNAHGELARQQRRLARSEEDEAEALMSLREILERVALRQVRVDYDESNKSWSAQMSRPDAGRR